MQDSLTCLIYYFTEKYSDSKIARRCRKIPWASIKMKIFLPFSISFLFYIEWNFAGLL